MEDIMDEMINGEAGTGRFEPMNIGEMELTFGKFKGKTTEQVYKESPDYIEWPSKNASDDVLRAACDHIAREGL